MSLRAVALDSADGERSGAANNAAPRPRVATPVSQTSPGHYRTNTNSSAGNAGGGGPLRSSSNSSSFHNSRSAGNRSVCNSGARTTSPSYRHNPYLASPASETCFLLASPESIEMEALAGNPHTQQAAQPYQHARVQSSNDVTSDRRLVVRSRSRRGLTSSTRSLSEGDQSRTRQPARMAGVSSGAAASITNPLGEQYAVDGAATTAAPFPGPASGNGHFSRHDSTASFSGDNSYSAALYSCAESSSYASYRASPLVNQLTTLVHAPAAPHVSSSYTHQQQRPESPATSRHSTANASSFSHGTPEASSLYYSFNNCSHNNNNTAATTVSNNPYVGVYVTPEPSAALSANHDGVDAGSRDVSPHTYGLPQRHLAPSAGPRMARAYPTASSRSTTPQNSPGVVVLNANDSVMSVGSTFVTPTAAAAHAAAHAQPNVPPRSHLPGTPPPYNQPSSAPLSPDTASTLIVPPSTDSSALPGAATLYPSEQLRLTATNASTPVPPVLPSYAHAMDAANSDRSSSQGSNVRAHYYDAAHPHTASPPAYNAYNPQGAPPPQPQSQYTTAHTTTNTTTADGASTLSPLSAFPTAHSHNATPNSNNSETTPPDSTRRLSGQTDVLSDRPEWTQFRGFGVGGGGSAVLSTDSFEGESGGAAPSTNAANTAAAAAGPAYTTPKTHASFLTSSSSANGATRTAAALPEMPSSIADAELGTPGCAQTDAETTEMRTKVARRGDEAPQDAHVAITSDDDDDDDEGALAAGTADGKKAKNKKKKRARRNRKVKFLEDLPPASEMKFLPPPPPPLPTAYEGVTDSASAAAAAAQTSSTRPEQSFDRFYSVLLRWYERILADEGDFVGLNHATTPATAPGTVNAAGHSFTSLEASHATLHNSGVLHTSGRFTPCSGGTAAGSTPGTTPSSAAFALSSFVNGGVGAAAVPTRTRRTPGGGEVPVLCPRIEQYVPLCDIPVKLYTAFGIPAAAAGAAAARRYSLTSNGTAAETPSEKTLPAAATDGQKAAAPTPLHVQHAERVVQWAKDLNSWWLCYIHPHSFNSRHQLIPQGFPVPPSLPPAPAPQSNMGSLYGWTPTSMTMPGYDGRPSFTSAGPAASNAAVSSTGTGSLATTAPPEHLYASLPMASYHPSHPPPHHHPHYAPAPYPYHSVAPPPPQHLYSHPPPPPPPQQAPMVNGYPMYR